MTGTSSHVARSTRSRGARDESLRSEISDVINRASAEKGSDTPDFILAEYLTACLAAFDAAVNARTAWHGTSARSTHEAEGGPSGG